MDLCGGKGWQQQVLVCKSIWMLQSSELVCLVVYSSIKSGSGLKILILQGKEVDYLDQLLYFPTCEDQSLKLSIHAHKSSRQSIFWLPCRIASRKITKSWRSYLESSHDKYKLYHHDCWNRSQNSVMAIIQSWEGGRAGRKGAIRIPSDYYYVLTLSSVIAAPQLLLCYFEVPTNSSWTSFVGMCRYNEWCQQNLGTRWG